MLINGKYELNLPQWRAEQWDIWHNGNGWEVDRIDAVMDLLAPGVKVWEIGAEVGDYPALWSTTGADVLIVEGLPILWPMISEIWNLNNELPPFGAICALVGSENKNGYSCHTGLWPPEAGLAHPGEHPGFVHLNEHVDHAQVTLDELGRAYGQPDVITMDIEGSELEALKSGRDVLTEGTQVFVSVHPDFLQDRYNQTEEDLLKFMEELGYESELLASDHEEHWKFT